jgi:hypothetical protein
MSSINTNGIDVNYPIPGQNNSSQGFRNNFAAIKTNLDLAGNEISDLQNKVVVKSALNNTTVNNDMGNTLISNASTRSFRATTYNLGNALAGTVLIDVSLGDVQYGTIAGDVQLQFGSWAPVGTQSNVQLNFAVSNTLAKITFPTEVVYSNNNYGLTTVENYGGGAGAGNISVPYGVSELNFGFSTLDCGDTIAVAPTNRPRQSTQIQQRRPAPTGFQGDVVGTTCVDPGAVQLTVSNTYANDRISTTSTSSLYIDQPVVFTGTAFGGVTAGTTYYVAAIPSSTDFTIATSPGGANVNLSAASGTMYANPVQYFYVATQDYNSTEYTKTVSQTIPTITLSGVTITGTAGQFGCTAASETLVVGQPVTISGTFGGTGSITGYADPTTYYIVATNGSSTFTLSTTVGGGGVTTTAGTPTGLTYTVATNVVILDNTTSLVVNAPVIFTGDTDVANTLIVSESVYYVKTIPDGTSITLSRSRTNGVADSTVTLGAWAAGNSFSATSYVGSDIWKRVALNSW